MRFSLTSAFGDGVENTRSMPLLPNMRLKLPAPALNESGERSPCAVVEFRSEQCSSSAAPLRKRPTELSGGIRAALVEGAMVCLVLTACHEGVTAPGPIQFASVTAGNDQSCGVSSMSRGYCWGSPLGDGTSGSSTTPVAIPRLIFSTLTAGVYHSCGLAPGGKAYCWGQNATGVLGNGTSTDSWTPVPVSGGLTFAMLTAGGGRTCGLTTDGAAYCWGENDSGELGTGNSSGPQMCRGGSHCSTTPVAVSGGLTFVVLSAGVRHTCGITATHVAYCWGYNFDGELGAGTTTGPDSCGGIPCSLTPVAVTGGLAFTAVSAGYIHSCGLTTAGVAYCWGNSSPGPDSVRTGLTFSAVSAAVYHTCGLTVAGAAYCWGYNTYGQLGNGDTTTSWAPVPVSGGLVFSAVSTGGTHSCALTVSHAVYCWGLNSEGELGNGTKTGSSVPVAVVY